MFLKTGKTHMNGWNPLKVKTLPTVMPTGTLVSPPQVKGYLHLKRVSKNFKKAIFKDEELLDHTKSGAHTNALLEWAEYEEYYIAW